VISIVDYKAGNLTSVKRALDYLGIPSEITADASKIAGAGRIIFPGVGHAGSAMTVLKERGIDAALRTAFSRSVPILGICLGTQIVLAHSEEGDTPCLGLMEGATVRFNLNDKTLKIPHMGWDSISLVGKHPILEGIAEKDEFYFVHSYYPLPASKERVLAVCEYEIMFPAVVGVKNLVATQFHPEKSGPPGLAMLRRFAQWDGAPC
jgi:glutamine amidotransferase